MKDKKLSIVKSSARTVLMVLKHAPLMVSLYAVLVLILSGQDGLSAPIHQLFYDSLTDLALGKGELSKAIAGACAVLGLILLGQIFGSGLSFLWQAFGDRIERGLVSDLHKKLAMLPAQLYEDSSFLDRIQKAQDGVYGILGMFTVVFEIFFYFGGYLLITGTYLWRIQPILVLSLLILFIPSAVSVNMQSKLYAEDEDSLAILKRRYGSFYSSAINSRETRLFGIFGYFNKLILDIRRQIFSRELKTAKANCTILLALGVIKALGWCGVIALLLRGLIRGEISIGAFAAVYYSIGRMFENIEKLFSRIKVDIAQNLGAIGDYLALMDMPVKDNCDAAVDFSMGIHARNLRFRYPNSERFAVDGVTIDINQGETVAIVGKNGSGKTTLAKLLCGLYTPDDGSVTLGGLDTSGYAHQILFERSTAVFQDYIKYAPLTLADNVRISQADSDKPVNQYLSAVKADFEGKLPQGEDTVMSRAFDGMELSGGQWQRVAMARGLYRDHDFIILDEPTSAIDPLEETSVYKMFAEHSRDKICILITHRLGSARIADRIIVMDAGKICEQGIHNELLALNGKYAEMWSAQAENYI